MPLWVRAFYGYEPDVVSATPALDAMARTAFTVELTNPHPDGVDTVGAVSITVIWVPATKTESGVVSVAVGGAISHRDGRFTASLEAPAATSVVFRRPFDVQSSATVRGVAAWGRPDAKALEFGETDGPHLDVATIALRLELSETSSIRLEAKGIDISLALADADPFIASLSQEFKTSFDLAVIYDKDGLRLDGGRGPSRPTTPKAPSALNAADVGTTSGGLEAAVPPKVTRFGPFRVQRGHFGIGRSSDGTRHTTIELAASADVHLGAFNLTIDRIGMKLDLRAGGVEPNLGLIDLDFGFMAPTGIGVSLDAKAIKGAGFLYLDEAKGEYAGVLTLAFKGITIKAIGLLNTRAPSPADWSLLLVLSAEFRDTPWQLGLGFNITAVGGILGLQHTASVEALRAALGTNSFDDVLFPVDPVKNAPRILGRLRTLFPVKAHALTVGPTVEVNWGTPPIVVARLGIVAQFSGAFGGGDLAFTRLTVIGTITAKAPTAKDSPRLVDITADVLGDYDAESGLLAIDARLRDSKLGGVEFSGSLIIRIGLGSVPAFALAAGGFHPAFTDLPPAMPARIDRLGLVWRVGDSIVLTLQAYSALTASSWQLGARFTLTAEIGPVDIDGALGFDAIAYDDGHFSVEIAGHVKIRWRGHTLMSVSIHMVLDRSARQVWHAAGSASFSVLWWDKEVDFEETWGTARSLPPAKVVNAVELVRARLADRSSWSARLPGSGDALVTLADVRPGAADPTRVMAHPLGSLAVSQSLVPLGLRLDQVDGAPVAPGTVVDIRTVRIGGAAAAIRPTTAVFARARFQKLDEGQLLTQKSFESFPAGLSITPPGPANPTGATTGFTFEEVRLAPSGSVPSPRPIAFDTPLRWHVQAGRAARSELRQGSRLGRGVVRSDVRVRPPEVVVVDERALRRAAELSEVEARTETLASQRLGFGQRVVERHEMGV